MNFFEKLFNKKEEVNPIVKDVICEHCNRIIHPYEKRKKFEDKRYHFKCFKKIKKKNS